MLIRGRGGRAGRAGRFAAAAVCASLMAVAGAGLSGAADGEPGVLVGVEPDAARGGAVFTVDLVNMDLPPGDDWIAVNVSRDGRGLSDDPSFDTIELRCPALADPGDAGVTHRCSFLLRAATAAGDYDIEVYIAGGLIDRSFFTVATLDTDIDPWWRDFEVTELSTSIFTGTTDLSVRFDSVPDVVDRLSVTARVDTDFDGFPDRDRRTIDCEATAPSEFACSTQGRPLPPLCVADQIAGRFCDDADYSYWFFVNEIDTGLSFLAVLERLSRFDEGSYFARQDYAAGRRLEDALDLDTFLVSSLEPCFETNGPQCYDLGYYWTWLAQYDADVVALIESEGGASATVADGVQVEAVIPRLPLGRHGFRAVASLVPTGAGAGAGAGDRIEIELACTEALCRGSVPTTPDPGSYALVLDVFNDHPAVRIVDENGEEVTFGQSRFASIEVADVIVGGTVLRCGPLVGTRTELTAAGFNVIVGTDGPDRLIGSGGPDVVLGLAGDDVVHTFGGDDVVCLGGGNDIVFSGTGADLVWGDAGRDRIVLGGGDDVGWGGTGGDVVLGYSGADRIVGSGGADLLDGGRGPDVVFGGPGGDTVDGGPGPDRVFGGGGDDIVLGGEGDDRLGGDVGSDRHVGGPGVDWCFTDSADLPATECERPLGT